MFRRLIVFVLLAVLAFSAIQEDKIDWVYGEISYPDRPRGDQWEQYYEQARQRTISRPLFDSVDYYWLGLSGTRSHSLSEAEAFEAYLTAASLDQLDVFRFIQDFRVLELRAEHLIVRNNEASHARAIELLGETMPPAERDALNYIRLETALWLPGEFGEWHIDLLDWTRSSYTRFAYEIAATWATDFGHSSPDFEIIWEGLQIYPENEAILYRAVIAALRLGELPDAIMFAQRMTDNCSTYFIRSGVRILEFAGENESAFLGERFHACARQRPFILNLLHLSASSHNTHADEVTALYLEYPNDPSINWLVARRVEIGFMEDPGRLSPTERGLRGDQLWREQHSQ